MTRTECSFSRSTFLHLSSVLRIASATQQNHNATADYCEWPRSKAWETCTSCKYSSPLAPFFPPKLLVRIEVSQGRLSTHSVLLRHTQCCYCASGLLRDRWGRVLLCVTDRLCWAICVCDGESWEVIYNHHNRSHYSPWWAHCLESTEREIERVRKRNSTSDPCGLYRSYFIPAVIGHLPTRDVTQTLTSWLVVSLHSAPTFTAAAIHI